MAVTAQQILQTCLYDLAEDLGFQLGLVTNSQWVDHLNIVIMDLLKRTGMLKRVYTQSVFSGVGVYGIPDDIVTVDSVFLAGRWLPPSDQRTLNSTIRKWKTDLGIPRYFYLDGLGLKSIGLAPAPNYNGAFVIGPNNPDPPYAIYDDFSATCQTGATQTVLNPTQHRDLTIVGTRKAITQVTALTDSIPLVPDDVALLALPFGVLGRIFASDSELLDSQRAAFCFAQFDEVVNVFTCVTGQPGAPEQ